ncbi:hypothetical protein J2TS6_10080 [Paenibacillus albilobatus]|uniref:Uncharacterized protein n=1 Tax=Paenibacillus albilobatus TaxID=2716884 RepID=A0A919XC13_9BACL|nr:hypothetical protein J2TS6_10080 [Paenibacillus albilobatus]
MRQIFQLQRFSFARQILEFAPFHGFMDSFFGKPRHDSHDWAASLSLKIRSFYESMNFEPLSNKNIARRRTFTKDGPRLAEISQI